MKMYHFNANDYGYEYYVMAENKYMAYVFFMQFLHDERKKAKEFLRDSLSEEIGKWATIKIDDPASFPQKYTLDEYEMGKVIRSEVA